MRRSRIDYGRLVETALRTVVRDVLLRLAKEGAPPPHHFYVTFRTRHPGVVIPEFLRDRYPTDMTIVLQHQFWGLEIEEDRFSVTLSFNNRQERLTVPFAAIASFADPAVKFGLQFETGTGEEEQPKPVGKIAPPPAAAVKPAAAPAASPNGADVVTLDAFRKK